MWSLNTLQVPSADTLCSPLFSLIHCTTVLLSHSNCTAGFVLTCGCVSLADSMRTTACLIRNHIETVNLLLCHTRFMSPPQLAPFWPSPPPTLISSLDEGIFIDPSVRPQHMARSVGDTESHNRFTV